VTRNDDDDNNNNGGRGLMVDMMQIEGAYITEVIKLKEYVEHTEDPLMQIVRTH
jgi:hypothetical protein